MEQKHEFYDFVYFMPLRLAGGKIILLLYRLSLGRFSGLTLVFCLMFSRRCSMVCVSSGGSGIFRRRDTQRDVANFSRKLHENEEILGGGGEVPRAPRSATGFMPGLIAKRTKK